MALEDKTTLPLEIAHVLFIDIVGYSKLLTDEQTEAVEQLNRIVREMDIVRTSEANGQLIRLPTGDGMALVFASSPEAPVKCAVQLSDTLRAETNFAVRMGIHSGAVHQVADVNGRATMAGAGLNICQRVMDCGDAGHILLSKRVADDLAQIRRWLPLLHDLGEVEVKHGQRVHLVNFYNETTGNPALPQKLQDALVSTPAPSPPPAATPASEESLFGNFEILHDRSGAPISLGQGTFGRTYKARHRYLETVVALKVISERFARDAAARESFLSEARAAARLSHPHIARLHDFGEKGGVLFYAMEFCAGGDLADFVKRQGKLSAGQLLEVAKQLGGALHCAHTAGLVHRDIKPSNLMLTSAEDRLETKLIDFGLVHVHGKADATSSASAGLESRLLGTPLFASPEQLREEPADARADLFSFGMTLWFLAEGRSPETGSIAEITTRRLSTDSYANRLPSEITGRLRAALQRLLEKDPAKRFATAGEFLSALNESGGAVEVAAPAAAPKSSAAETEALELEGVASPLASEWQIAARHSDGLTGVNYPAHGATDSSRKAWLHVLHDPLLANVDLLWRVRRNAARFIGLRLDGLLTPLAMRRYSDHAAIILEKPECTTLLSAVSGPVAGVITELYPFLEKIAAAADAVAGAWLPGVELNPANIWLLAPANAESFELNSAQPKLFPRFLAARDAPELSSAGEADLTSTVTADMMTSPASADDIRGHFARLIYRLAAGRNCPVAASLSAQAYVAVPNLSEQANRLLAGVIARQAEYASCAQLLANLRRSEGATASAKRGGRGLARFARGARATPLPTELTATPPVTSPTSAPAFATAVPKDVSLGKPITEPAAQPKRIPIAAMVSVGLALAVIIAGFFGYRILSRPKQSEVTQSTTTSKTTTEPSFPPETKLRLPASGVPRHATFTLGGKPLDPLRNGSDILLNLAGATRKFPLEIAAEATGFKKAILAIRDEAQLAESQSVSLFRSTGRILFTGIPSDYTHASVSMKSLLPEEKDLDEVRLERADRGTELRAGGRNAIELATGVYSVSLRGDNGRAVRPRILATEYELKPDGTVTINLPPSFAGRYEGQVADAGDNGAKFDLEITIEPGLTSGSLTERRGGATRQASWSGGAIDAEGIYRARIQFADSAGTSPAEVSLALRPVEGKKIALTSDPPAGAREKSAKDAPFYAAGGELQRAEAAR